MIFIYLAFSTGVVIVINMMLNGRLAQQEGMINGILVNYLTASVSSVVLCAVMVKSIPAYSKISSIPMPYFIGGILGVLTTYLFNIIVPRVPAVYVVILRFIGQMLASALIDYLYLDIFSDGKLIGGMLFLIGLLVNARVDGKYKEEKAAACENI